ncbi:hypothetical protein CP974_18030 [Streptomyces fradiae ATCC 10745 = DSM 40063]|nr:hypothetical protein CP974_18030 [Streptomyces fradiae ATCC 10745 = DSM 40063]
MRLAASDMVVLLTGWGRVACGAVRRGRAGGAAGPDPAGWGCGAGAGPGVWGMWWWGAGPGVWGMWWGEGAGPMGAGRRGVRVRGGGAWGAGPGAPVGRDQAVYGTFSTFHEVAPGQPSASAPV